jgi:hypothetical protein
MMYGISSSNKLSDIFPSNISDIISNVGIANGYYRPNRFVVLLPDKYVPEGSKGNKKTIMMNCSAVSVPGMSFTTVERREGSQTFKVPYDYVTEDINLTFFCSEAFLERQYFNYWFGDVFNPAFRCYSYFKGAQGTTSAGMSGYAQNFDIVLLSDLAASMLKNAKSYLGGSTLPLEVFHVKVFDAFPKTLSPMNLNYESMDTIGTFDVTISCLNVATSNKIALADYEGDFADIYLATLIDFTTKYGSTFKNVEPSQLNLSNIANVFTNTLFGNLLNADMSTLEGGWDALSSFTSIFDNFV